MNITPKISVIVPVYNTEKYLTRCIDSILSQTFTDFELLLIDDGSKDSSGAICDEYAAKDNRVRVFHKENVGVSSARNLGLDNAKCEWIAFVDSDDWVENDYLKLLYDNNDDLVVSACIYEKPNKIVFENLIDKQINIGYNNLTDILMKGVFMTPYCALYRYDILEDYNIRFDNLLSSREDTLFDWTYIFYINRIRIISNTSYHYCINVNGLSNKRIDIDECVYSLNCFYKLLIEFQNKYKGFDFRHRHLWLVDEMFKKSMREEVCCTRDYIKRKKCLEKLLKCKSIISLLCDKVIIPKGIKRKIFDYLALNNYVSLLTIYVYII